MANLFGEVLSLPVSVASACDRHSGCNCDNYTPCDQCNPDDQ